jgi:phosphatidate cytidylyltransferase
MKTRILAGVVAAILATLLVFCGPDWLLLVVAEGCAVLAYVEYATLFFPKENFYHRFRMLPFICLALYALVHAIGWSWIFLWAPFLFVGLSGARRANITGDFIGDVRQVALETTGFLYVVCLLGFLTPVGLSGPHGREYLYLLFMIVFGGDTFAYFSGMMWGRHRLATQLSPKKSIEGAIGAIVGTLVFAAAWLLVLYRGEKTPAYCVRLFACVPVVSGLAQMGDLFESLLKRSQAQKDSGHFLPGHGGILDRLDGMVFAAPVFYLYLILVLDKP